MSTRYRRDRLPAESNRYVEQVLELIGDSARGCDVLELGGGIGRLTKPLAEQAGRLTCLDLSSEMLERNREHLGPLAQKVNYRQTFIQDYRPDHPHDVAIVSLVLIHNVDRPSFEAAVDSIRRACRTVVLCEHVVDQSRGQGSATFLRSADDLLAAFSAHRPGIPAFESAEPPQFFDLFSDRILMAKLVRSQ